MFAKKLVKFSLLLSVIVAIAYLAAVSYFHFTYPQDSWNWTKIETNDVSFPKDFIWGTATAAHQR